MSYFLPGMCNQCNKETIFPSQDDSFLSGSDIILDMTAAMI